MRKIIHVDMDCFFAAVEMRDQPNLQRLPIAVGGASDRRGVIATCNYEARKFGVRSAMATSTAMRLCPQLQLVRPRMAAYKEASVEIGKIFRHYTHLIEPLSLDEAYLDVSDSKLFQGSATLIAKQIRADIFHKLQLTASAGIAPNKFLAKVASDLNKPNGQYVIPPEQVADFIVELPLEKIPGVGKATLARLHQHQLFQAKDVQQQSVEFLTQQFGKFGLSLYERCHGVDERAVQTSRVRKSVGVETTLAQDLHQQSECEQVLGQLYQELNQRVDRANVRARIARCGLKVKFSDFSQTTVEHQKAALEPDFYLPLLQEALARGKGKGIRLLGLSVGLQQKSPQQMDLPLLG